MKISSDDPKLTTYALGELDKNETEQIERELQNSPELREAIAEVRETAALLKRELSSEPALSLNESQKNDVFAKTKRDNIIPLPFQRIFKGVGIGAIAASVALVLTWQFGQGSKRATIAPQNAISQAQKDDAVEKKTTVLGETIDPEWLGVLEKPKFPHSSSNRFVGRHAVKLEAGKSDGSTPAEKIQANGRSSISIQGNPTDWSASLSGVTASEPQLVEAQIPVGNPTAFKNALTQLSTGTGTGGGGGGGGGQADKSDLTTIEMDGKASILVREIQASAPEVKIEAHFSEISRNDAKNLGFNWSAKNDVTPQLELAELEAVRRQSYAVERRDATSVSASLRGFYDEGEEENLNRFKGRFLGGQLIEQEQDSETARYPKYVENNFQSVSQEPLSTFSIDVDTASYANVRRFLNEDRLPPGDAVRIEELINYFSYNYPQPKGDEPFSANLEVAGCPWNSQHRLVRIGLKGKEIAQDKRPPSNFVFLIDVSGSMSPSERLPLIKQALRMLVKRITENDRIAIVVYASSSGVMLESTLCANKEKILAALDRLEAGGSTNGGEGVQRAYALAEENFIEGGVNRVILCTDGDFNVGITDQSELVSLIERKARSGVFLSALGVGTDNYKDALMQKLADKGNGNYHYIDTMEEAQKVLIQQIDGTLVTIAKDVKIQIEFNPAQVSSYRLIGYEKRILAAEDFNNDKKDAGEIGAGHTVTALYEIVPANGQGDGPRGKVDDLKYQKPTPEPKREINNDNPELLTLKLRYKKPDGKTSKLSETALIDGGKNFNQASSDFRFASAVAGFGMILKNSEHKGEWTFKSVLDVAEKSKSDDKEGYRAEFINLVKKAKALERRE